MATDYEYRSIVSGIISINYGGLMKIADDLREAILDRRAQDAEHEIADNTEIASLLYEWACQEQQFLEKRAAEEAAKKQKAA
jgi:hypothetical protein